MKKIIVSLWAISLVLSIATSSFAATHKRKHHYSQTGSNTSLQQQVSDLKQNQKTLEKKVDDQGEYIEKQKGNWSNKFEGGWKKGLYFQTADGKYSTKFRVRIQPQYSYTSASKIKEGKDDQSTFRIRRAKVSWEGNLFSKNLDYKFQLNAAVSNWQDVLEDAYVNYKVIDPFRIQFGQEKVQYNRQELNSSGRLELVDRSLAADAFRFSTVDSTTNTVCTLPGGGTVTGSGITCGAGATTTTTTTNTPRQFHFDTGLIFWGTAFNRKMEYYAGIMNGTGPNRLDTNNRFLYTGRLVGNILGDYGYSESDVEYSEHPSLTIGASGGYKKQEVTNAALYQEGAELGFKYKGASLQGEFYARQTNSQGAAATTKDYGYYVQAGYFVLPRHLELAARASQVFLAGANNNKAEYMGGINYYFLGHDLKIQTDFSYLKNETTKGVANDFRARAQLQAWF